MTTASHRPRIIASDVIPARPHLLSFTAFRHAAIHDYRQLITMPFTYAPRSFSPSRRLHFFIFAAAIFAFR
jgi:hypothetical protein